MNSYDYSMVGLLLWLLDIDEHWKMINHFYFDLRFSLNILGSSVNILYRNEFDFEYCRWIIISRKKVVVFGICLITK